VKVTVDVDSISTGSADRDKHLRSPDFFDVNAHKDITFVTTRYENVDNDGSYELYGDLTIRDVTKNIKLAVEFGGVVKDPWGNTRAGFTINGKINRKDFGLNWNAATETGGVLVGDDVKISGEVQLVKK
jgi:polyisoprenoid-binding protein YceI